jgi:hypothetical protein
MPNAKYETRRGGPRALAAMLPKIARPAFGKRGFVEAGVLTDWPVIVGPVLAAETRPMKLTFPRGARTDGTLHIRVTSAFSTELQHLAPLVMERINRYFGYGAVARLTLSQGPVIRPLRNKRQKSPDPEPEALRRLETRVAAIEDEELRVALAGLGRNIASRQAGRKAARRPV